MGAVGRSRVTVIGAWSLSLVIASPTRTLLIHYAAVQELSV